MHNELAHLPEIDQSGSHSWDIDRLNTEIDEYMGRLTVKQQKFILALVSGESAYQAAQAAGYSHPGSIATNTKQSSKVQYLLRLFSRKYQLENGIAPAWKRQQLAEIAEMHKEGTPAAAVSAVKTLAQIDGDIAPAGGSVLPGEIQINIVTGISRETVTIEHEPEEPEFQGFL